MLELTVGQVRSMRLNGRTVKYCIRRVAAAKKRRLQVSPGGVVVILPKGDPETRAIDFIRQNAAWVTQEIAALLRRAEAFGGSLSRMTMLLKGEPVTVEFQFSPTARATRIEMASNRLAIHVPVGADVAAKLETWLRKKARSEIATVIARRSHAIGVKPGRLYIRGQRTKWGNCSRLRNLSFNWRLAMVPPAVLDYLVVHELAHLHEVSHTQRFWFLVRQACPQYARHQQWLRASAHRLALPAELRRSGRSPSRAPVGGRRGKIAKRLHAAL